MSEETKTRISIAAATLFCNYGHKKTTLRLIGEQVGISHVSVLRYFKSKNELATQTVVNYIAGLEKLCYRILEGIPRELADIEYCRHMMWWNMHYRILSENPIFREFYISFWGEGQTVFTHRALMPGPEALQFIRLLSPKEDSMINGSIATALDATFARLIGMKAVDPAKATKLMIVQLNKLGIDLPHLPDENEIRDFEKKYLSKQKVDLLNDILLINYSAPSELAKE